MCIYIIIIHDVYIIILCMICMYIYISRDSGVRTAYGGVVVVAAARRHQQRSRGPFELPVGARGPLETAALSAQPADIRIRVNDTGDRLHVMHIRLKPYRYSLRPRSRAFIDARRQSGT